MLLEGRLADNAFTGMNTGDEVLPCIEGVAGEQPQIRIALAGVIDIENAMLDIGQRREFGQNDVSKRPANPAGLAAVG